MAFIEFGTMTQVDTFRYNSQKKGGAYWESSSQGSTLHQGYTGFICQLFITIFKVIH